MLVDIFRIVLKGLAKILLKMEVRGLENLHALGDKAVIICNHQSFLDPFLLAIFLPGNPSFAMNTEQAKKWYFKPLLKLVKVYEIDPLNPMSIKSVMEYIKHGNRLVIFPEGRITTTGGTMKVYEGTGLIVEQTKAPVLPIRIQGAEYSYFSRLGGQVRRRLLPRVSLYIFPPTELYVPTTLKGRAARAAGALAISDLMNETAFHALNSHQTLYSKLISARRQHGAFLKVACDINQNTLSYFSLLMKSAILARLLAKPLEDDRFVALMLPNATGGIATFFALQRLGKIPAMLNFSAGIRSLKAACEMVEATHIVTSRVFIEKGKLEEVIAALAEKHEVIYLEDLRPNVKLADKLAGIASAIFPKDTTNADPDDVSLVLFTSGSEGTPKGVALSHNNILSNAAQVAAKLSFTQKDIMFNAMPMFHSFGLTVGTLLPLFLGFRTFMYPSPVHYRIIPELVYDLNATIMLGTDTFFRGYSSYAHPYDFYRVRLAVAGAEKLKEETRRYWADHYRVNIMQGYGVTETAPVISANTPVEHKPGTVGRIFPGMEMKLETVEGIPQGGRLFIKGPNVMLGYIKVDKPGVIQRHEGWYDTGDIVDVDEDGFLYIQGRAKRFAKIGGEMISLTIVEEFLSHRWSEKAHATVAVSDPTRGEMIVLFTEEATLTREIILTAAREHGLPELALPKKIVHVDAIPRLGSGKVDYVTLGEMAKGS